MKEIPIWERMTISVEEAAAYSGIGIKKIRELINEPDCDFVIKVGSKKLLVKREKFEKYILAHEVIWGYVRRIYMLYYYYNRNYIISYPIFRKDHIYG